MSYHIHCDGCGGTFLDKEEHTQYSVIVSDFRENGKRDKSAAWLSYHFCKDCDADLTKCLEAWQVARRSQREKV